MTQIPVAGLNAELALGTAKLSAGVSEAGRMLGGLEQRFGNTGRKARQAGDDIDRGLNKGLRGAGNSAATFEKRIDALARKFDPLYAASKRYEQEVEALNDALRLGAVSQKVYEQNLERLNAELANGASGFGRATQQAQAFNATAGTMASQTSNIAAQFQDIGVQLASGQSPFLIALQQGTQLNGVFTQMGGGVMGVAKGLGSAFMSLVSPLSLITIGAIAAGGALLQWATSAGQATEETERLNAAAERQKRITDDLLQVIQQLRIEREMMASGATTEAEQNAMNELKNLALERVVLQQKIADLHAEANENLGMINTTELERLNTAIALNEQKRAENESLLLLAERERARLEAAQLTEQASRQLQSVMRQLNNIDVSAPWREAVGLIFRALQGAQALARGSLQYSGRGGDPRQFGANAGRSNTFNVENFRIPAARSGGGGGGRAATAETTAGVQALNAELAKTPPMVQQLSDAFGSFVASGFKDFRGFTRAIGQMFQRTLAEMVSTALRNRIMIGLGFNVQGGGGAGGAGGAATSLLGAGGGLSNLLFSGGTGTAGLPSFGGLLGGGLGVLGPLAIGGAILGGLFARRRRRRQAAAAAAQAAAQEAQAEAQERAGLEGRLLQVQGDTTELRRRELETLRPANRELQERIWRLEDEKRIGEERKGLEVQLLQLQGDTAELRRRELEALDPSNRALQENIWRLEDAAEATDKLNEALGKLSADDFATALDFNRARGMLGAVNPATAPASVQAALSAATASGSPVLGGMADALLANINSNIALLWKTVQRFDLEGMPPVRA